MKFPSFFQFLPLLLLPLVSAATVSSPAATTVATSTVKSSAISSSSSTCVPACLPTSTEVPGPIIAVSTDAENTTTISLFAGGILGASIIVDANGNPLYILDANGTKIDPSQLDELDPFLNICGIPWGILKKIWEFIKNWGPKAVAFFKCIGTNFTASCWEEIASCLTASDPWSCLAGLACGGTIILQCVKAIA